ncbi:DUF6011 domain-containing protein [Streptomyces sp. NPDC052069]|uniref:DUF6011 domain-containing protein n=1 Tax=Streptomyces sp. NPDC052069 TaxID=3154650 RepID=UPI003416459C
MCGRRLRSAASQARGLGPVCARRTRSHTAPAGPEFDPIPGQIEIPLPPMQHHLTWSP